MNIISFFRKKFVNNKHGDYDARWFIEIIISTIFLIGMLYFDRINLILPSPAPSGADPGNWLTAAWQLSGVNIRLVDWAYPPFLFVLLRLVLFFFSPMTSLRIVGIFAWLLVGVIFFVMARIFSPRRGFYIHLGITIFIVFSGYQGEMYNFGGYPQLLGSAFLLCLFPSLDQWLRERKKSWLIVSIISFEGVLYTHNLLTGVMLVYISIMIVLTLIRHRSEFRKCLKGWLLFLIPTFILALPSIWIYWHIYLYLGIMPINSQGFSFNTISLLFDYVFENQKWLWLPLICLAFIFSLINRKHVLSNTVFLFLGGTIVLLFLVWEVRLSQLLIIGVGYGLILIYDSIYEKLQEKNFKTSFSASYCLIIIILLLLSLPVAKRWFVDSNSYYQVVDRDTYLALDWLRLNSNSSSIIAGSPWKPSAIGWWIQGFAQRSCIFSGDLDFYIFKSERDNVAIANYLFSDSTSISDSIQIIDYLKIKYLFIDKINHQNIIDKFTKSGYFINAFENNRVLILEFK